MEVFTDTQPITDEGEATLAGLKLRTKVIADLETLKASITAEMTRITKDLPTAEEKDRVRGHILPAMGQVIANAKLGDVAKPAKPEPGTTRRRGGRKPKEKAA